MAALLLTGLAIQAARAEDLRVATFNAELSRRGPGLLYAAIRKGNDAQILAVQAVIAAVRPDVLLLTGFDYDHDQIALSAFAAGLAGQGVTYPHLFALRPNTGMASGLDLNGDGRTGDAADAQGWGRFAGADGMAVLSRHPILADQARDFSALLWRDFPGAHLPEWDDVPFPSPEALAVQRLSTTGHWDVPIETPQGVLHLLAFYATPPVFDGPEDRNGWRNHDEVTIWTAFLDGKLDWPAPDGPFVVLGDANLDPSDGNGRKQAIRGLLDDPRLQDARPASAGGAAAASPGQRGDPALDTADWPEADDAEKPGPGNLRVDYVLPSVSLKVFAAGTYWPAPGQAGADIAAAASRHRLVWVDVRLP